MELIIVIIAVILFGYILNIFWLIVGFQKIPYFQADYPEPKTKFSIVIPFRNEKNQLPKLLESVQNLDYPKDLFEVLLVDDDSDEKFILPEKKENYTAAISILGNVRKTLSPKKDAINTAIQKAQNDWILSTDADCIAHPLWLKTLDAYIQHKKPKMIASGVMVQQENSFLAQFQQLDFLSLQGTTIGSFGNQQAFMCNGANFAYTKDFFISLQGFEGNENIASGDDVFLLQKAIRKEPSSVHFLKSTNAIIRTKTENSWSALWQQRLRWASKTANYQSFYSKQLAWSVFLMNLSMVICLILCVATTFPVAMLLCSFVLKFSIDLALLYQTGLFFAVKPRHILLSSLIYPLFTLSIVFYALLGKYTWKGRVFKK